MMTNYAEQRAEAASADIRRTETIVSRNASRDSTALREIQGVLAGAIERANALRARIDSLADRTFGEIPEMPTDTKERLLGGPPYGGCMAELFYAAQQLSIVIDEANQLFSRLENIA